MVHINAALGSRRRLVAGGIVRESNNSRLNEIVHCAPVWGPSEISDIRGESNGCCSADD